MSITTIKTIQHGSGDITPPPPPPDAGIAANLGRTWSFNVYNTTLKVWRERGTLHGNNCGFQYGLWYLRVSTKKWVKGGNEI